MKQLVQHTAATLRPWRWFGRDRLLLLMYHRVLPADHPDMPWVQPGMYVTPDTLKRHISWLREGFDLVDLQDWLELGRVGRQNSRRVCAITFDDGWLDNYENAWPVLRAEQAPATMFVVSALVGSSQSFWPERLARLVWHRLHDQPLERLRAPPCRWVFELVPAVFVQGRQRTRAGIDRLIVAAKRHPDQEIIKRLEEIEYVFGGASSGLLATRDLANWAELKEMSDSGLVRLGSHTRHHARLQAGLSESVLRDEVLGSAKEIEKYTGQVPTLFCYPNGDICRKAEDIVSQYYSGAVTTARGWNSSKSNLYRLRRIGMHQDIANDRSAFMAKLSGWY